MKLLSYLALDNGDFSEVAQELPIQMLSISDLSPLARRAARNADVVEIVRPDVRRQIKNTYHGIQKS